MIAVFTAVGQQVLAATLTVSISDRDGQPVQEIVVYATPLGQARTDVVQAPSAVMDQRDEQFTPHILVAQRGTAVAFPNSDTVSHHVYSFSAPKRFELPLYQGTAHPPVIFDEPGIVDVGCNIHDHMEAHIVVVDTPYFAKTDADGHAELSGLPHGDFSVQIFTPRLKSRNLPEAQHVTMTETDDSIVEIQLEDRLRPSHTSHGDSLHWSRY